MNGIRGLLEHKLIFVLGKGGVGRTTITSALGRAAALQGKRACVAELGANAALPPRFGLSGRSFEFRRGWSPDGDPRGPGVDVWSLTVPECLEDFGARKLHLPSFARRMLRNRFLTTFVDSVPGLHDLLPLGKIENLIQDPRPTEPVYDTLIIDAPATGHGLTLLTAARTMTSITRAGPFYELARALEELLADPERTARAVVTLPEALPVSETLELVQALDDENLPAHTVIANRVEPPTLPDVPRGMVHEVLGGLEHGPALDELATRAWAREDRQSEALDTLRQELLARGDAPPVRAPLAHAPADDVIAHALAEVL